VHLLGHPDAEFFCGKLGRGAQKEKRSKKERNGSWRRTRFSKSRLDRA
jgi:hypothetical protein